MLKIEITQIATLVLDDGDGVDHGAIAQAAWDQAHELLSWHAPKVWVELCDPDLAATHELVDGKLRAIARELPPEGVAGALVDHFFPPPGEGTRRAVARRAGWPPRESQDELWMQADGTFSNEAPPIPPERKPCPACVRGASYSDPDHNYSLDCEEIPF